jgi:mannose-6-phosphate isomerase-like protein (cupin superfamily)
MKIILGVGNMLLLAGLLRPPVMSVPPEAQSPHAKVVSLVSVGKELSILSGPPETVSMRSGLILLKPNESVGKHSTGQHEEELVILEGKGEMRFKDGSHLPVQANHALYCPPETEHDVVNTGMTPLRYVYVVASAK